MNARRDALRDEGLRGRLGPRAFLPPVARAPDQSPQAAKAERPDRLTPATAKLADSSPGRGDGRHGGRFIKRRKVEFHPSDVMLEEAPRSPIRAYTMIVIAAIVGCAFAWSYFGRFEFYASAPGKIQVTGLTKVVEALAQGKVARILVHDGDLVKAG